MSRPNGRREPAIQGLAAALQECFETSIEVAGKRIEPRFEAIDVRFEKMDTRLDKQDDTLAVNVEAQTPHFQSQAVAMPAMATGAIGFGLFGADFRVSTELLPTFKFVAGGIVLVCYVALVRSVRDILESDEVTGRDVVIGPLFRLFLVVIYVVSIFVADIFDNPAAVP